MRTLYEISECLSQLVQYSKVYLFPSREVHLAIIELENAIALFEVIDISIPPFSDNITNNALTELFYDLTSSDNGIDRTITIRKVISSVSEDYTARYISLVPSMVHDGLNPVITSHLIKANYWLAKELKRIDNRLNGVSPIKLNPPTYYQN